MAIKKLQNNFTTPEQSKRLLELGLPADSADCYFFTGGRKYDGVPRPFFLFPRTYEYIADFNDAYGDKVLPCWSVGRLMEICKKCCITEKLYKQMKDRTDLYLNMTDGWITEMVFEVTRDNIHFSKLEE